MALINENSIIGGASIPKNLIDRYGPKNSNCQVSSGYGIGNNTINCCFNNTCPSNTIVNAINMESELIQSIHTPLFYIKGETPSTFSFQIEPSNFNHNYQCPDNIIYNFQRGGRNTFADRQNKHYKK